MMTWTRAYLVPLRLVIGIGFVLHGQAKLARGPEQFADVLDALGVPLPHVAAWLTILVEIIGGLAVIAGAYRRATAVVLAGVLATAIVGVHWQYGFSSVRLIEITDAGARFGPVGYELALVYLAALAALAVGEPTPWSIDRWRKRKPTPR
jgi:putative oxidoreductase